MAKKKPAKKTAKPAAKKPAKKIAKPAKKPAVKKAAPKKALPKKAASKKATPKKTAKPAAKKVAAPKPTAVKFAAPKAAKSADFSKLISPLDDRLLVQVEEMATRTPGGLYIPDSVDHNERHKQGKVVAVGRGHVGRKGKLRPLDVQLGDTVIFAPFMGSQLEVSGQEVLVLRESELLGVVKA